jgi:hypothetical protein
MIRWMVAALFISGTAFSTECAPLLPTPQLESAQKSLDDQLDWADRLSPPVAFLKERFPEARDCKPVRVAEPRGNGIVCSTVQSYCFDSNRCGIGIDYVCSDQVQVRIYGEFLRQPESLRWKNVRRTTPQEPGTEFARSLDRMRDEQVFGKRVGIPDEVILESVQTSARSSHFDLTGITEEEQLAIGHYTAGMFSPVNRALRNVDPVRRADSAGFIATLDRALAKMPVYTGEVYRLETGFPVSLLPAIQEGSEFVFTAYASTSKLNLLELLVPNANPGTNLGALPNVIWRLHSRQGRWVEPLSVNPKEQEVLFARGSRFRILKRETRAYPKKPGADFVFIEAEELP